MKKLFSMNPIAIALLTTCLVATASCTTDEDPTAVVKKQEAVSAMKQDTEKPYTYVEHMPAYKGSESALHTFLGENIKYPEAAIEAGIEGLAVVSFVVEKDGSVTDVQVVKNLSAETDQEALRVVQLTSGNWIPGKQGGETVRVKYTLPIRFALK